MHEAGSDSIVGYSKSELAKFIHEAKGMPVQRNSSYTKFRRFDDDDREMGIRLPISTSVGE